MNNLIRAIAVSTLIIGTTCIGATTSTVDWPQLTRTLDSYVSKSNKQDAAVLLERLPSCDSGVGYDESFNEKINPESDTSNDYSKLKSLAQGGDIDAIKVMFRLTLFFCGGEGSEVESQDLGEISVTHPREFLLAYSATKTQMRGLNHILAGLGPDYVDDVPAQIKELKIRYASLSQVRDVSDASKDAQEECLQVLKDEINLLEQVEKSH